MTTLTNNPVEQRVQFIRRSLKERRQLTICLPRMGGKSTTAAALAVAEALAVPKQLILMAAPTKRQQLQLEGLTWELAKNLDAAGASFLQNKPTIVLANDSWIRFVPDQDRLTFPAPDLIILDEADRVPHRDELWRLSHRVDCNFVEFCTI